ncbi:MAG: type II toxin-antitoxin system VapC family toxin [Chromatiales bacterium]
MEPVKALLDTHTLLWWLFDDPKLSRRARTVIKDRESIILVSSASAWEIATKHRLGKLPEAGEAVSRLPALINQSRFDTLPITLEHALAAGMLPTHHRDPFDRMLIAQAQIEELPIVTNDRVFKNYNVEVLW